jgi:lysozyme
MIDNKIDYQVALEVASHEAIVREAYKDTKGVWTWSIGLTNASGHNVERYIGKPQTLQHCLAVYVWALEKYADDVRAAFTRPLTQEQFAAALSFHYNTGAIKKATWVKSFNAGNISAAKTEIMNYKTPPEIVSRRKTEQNLFFNGVWSNNGTILEYQVNENSKPVNPKAINIETELKAAFVQNEPVVIVPSKDTPVVVVPSTTGNVEIKPTPVNSSLHLGKILSLLVAVGGAIAAAIAKFLGVI